MDPSSPFTGGAILGDRVRMQGHATDSGIFIRSMATRGYLGGLAQTTGDTALLLDAAGKQMIWSRPLAWGRARFKLCGWRVPIVVLVPGMGDDVQSLKAGLMEIGDIFVIDKSDREGADRFEQQLAAFSASFQSAKVGSRQSSEPSPQKIMESTPWRSRSSSSARISTRRRNVVPAKWRTGRNGCCGCSKAGLWNEL